MKPKPARKWNQDAKIVQALRKVWRYSPARLEALAKAKAGVRIRRCFLCAGIFHEKLCEVHHVESVGKKESWDAYINRLFCPVTSLIVVCEECHKRITKEQAEKAKAERANRKQWIKLNLKLNEGEFK